MIDLQHVTKHYETSPIIDDVSLTIERGEFFVLIGSSGAGKSTLLRMINRLIPCSSGTIRFDGQDISRVPEQDLRRRMGYVIQSIGLFPHWTIERNVGAVPTLLGWPRDKIRDRTSELLDMLSLDPAQFRQKYPHQLSIGQQQRVGVARALAAEPDVLLMDEPFSALDPLSRDALQNEMWRIHDQSQKTIILVTHDMDEALKLASRMAIMDRGRVVQVGTPLQMLTEPANGFVRDFIGSEERGLKLLSLETVESRVRRDQTASGDPIAAAATLRQALSRMIAERVNRLSVIDAEGKPLGAILLSDLVQQ